VLALANYTISPSFGQFVYTTPKKFLIFRGKPFIKSFSNVRKNRSAAQRARGPSTKTGDSQKVPSLVNKRDGVALPS